MERSEQNNRVEEVEEKDSLLKEVVEQEKEDLSNLGGEVNKAGLSEKPEGTLETDGEETEENKEEKKEDLDAILKRQEEAREGLKKQADIQMVSEFTDEEGNVISARVKGKVALKMLNIETDIQQVKRFRTDDNDVYGLQDSIRRYGLLEPVHVVPFGDHFVLVQGYRRLQAHINLGKNKILAIVDSTIPPELAKYFQVEMNNVLKYGFEEKLRYGKYVESTQKNLGVDAVEQSLGLKTGEYLKMKYIEQFRDDFPDIYRQVTTEKLSIEQAYKKIDKEIEKQQKELDNMDELNSGEMDDDLRDQDLSELQGESNQQGLGKRKILDANTRRFVEARAVGQCECCGYGKDEPDLVAIFKVHHIIPVQFMGSDSKQNLILLCNNCHEIVHKYEQSSIIFEQETYDRRNDVKRTVVLGNMILVMRKKALHLLRTEFRDIGSQVDKGNVTIGQGIEKSGMSLKGEEYFGGSPYDEYYKNTESLDYGGEVTGELASIGNTIEDEEN